jgi:hypothetical protein
LKRVFFLPLPHFRRELDEIPYPREELDGIPYSREELDEIPYPREELDGRFLMMTFSSDLFGRVFSEGKNLSF